MADYKTAATKNFNALMQLYGSASPPASFWKLANTFHTMMDYAGTVYPPVARQVAQAGITQFNNSVGSGVEAWWFDDLGWWTVAAQRALNFFGSNPPQQLLAIRDKCWAQFSGNAPFVWERRKPGTFDECQPAVAGGVWQVYWLGTPENWKGPRGDPTGGVNGDQNTVTNSLYLMAAKRGGYIEPAKKELTFLETWFNDTKTPLWWQIDAGAGLVRERVGHFANGSITPKYQDDWFWAGDQGLMLGNLSDAAVGGNPNALSRVQHLLAGVTQRLVDSSTGVLRNWSTTGHVPGNGSPDYDDYETRIGCVLAQRPLRLEHQP
jgi:hypothetical protein